MKDQIETQYSNYIEGVVQLLSAGLDLVGKFTSNVFESLFELLS